MDPKMDSGCVNQETQAEEPWDVSKPLLPEEVLGIMDQLLCHEMSWHLGYPLSQTLLTGVYVEALSMPDPQDITEATFVRDNSCVPERNSMLQILRAYCLGLLKSCGYVNERIKSEHFYEEEDFVTNTYHRTLLARIPTKAIREALAEAIDLVKSLEDPVSADLRRSSLLDRDNDEVEVIHDPRTLCHLIRDWESLQVDAEEIDQSIQAQTKEHPVMHQASFGGAPVEAFSLPLSSWTYLYKVRQMEWIVQLGFELEVYQPDELAGMYWYLNYLSKSRLQHAERIQTFILHQVGRSHATMLAVDPRDNRQLQRSLNFTRLSLLDSAVTWELSDSLSCLYAVLLRLKLIKTPPRPYSTDEQRYSIRMRPFASIGHPILPTFEEFTAGTLQLDTEPEELLEYGERAVAGAKKAFEVLSKRTPEESFSVGSHERWMASVKNGLKSCIATGIAISAVQDALARAEDPERPNIKVEIPTPDKAYHEWWIVPKIVRA
ncbi:N-alpha-acetyltransferase [Escovopsis weberi]|uniref:N-alpha-acetyltransferase n=1 Tax=Escovopsis weberi TaxID=150374 RepID=A0A0M8N9R0_ESCWE|nr:N-alpha-acetyltransferase [Escovopsis weberi]